MLEINLKRVQQSMKLWLTACNTANLSFAFVFNLWVVQS